MMNFRVNRLFLTMFGAWVLIAAPAACAGRPPGGDDSLAQSLKPPYLTNVEERGGITIWIVDGTFVRTHIDEEFTNYGQHYAFKFIPANEFWIDREGKPDEMQFFISNQSRAVSSSRRLAVGSGMHS